MASSTASFPSTSFNSLSTFPIHRTRHSPPSYVTFRRSSSPISAIYTTTSSPSTCTSLETTSFYELLGIEACASGKEIKAAYRKLARVLHPDVAAVTASDANSSEVFIRVNEAYATLSDPKKRADYDRMMWLQGRRLSYSPSYCSSSMGGTQYTTTSFSGFSGYTRRTWETDQCW